MSVRVAHRQLGFPWCPLRTIDEVQLDGDEPLRAEVRASHDEVELTVHLGSPREPGEPGDRHERSTARLRVGREPAFELDGQSHWWSFEPQDRHDDALASVIEWATWCVPREGPRPARSEARDARRRAITRLATTAAAIAWELGEEPARSIAMAFAPRARAFVYAGLCDDVRGRFAQLVEAWPGLLALAALSPSAVPLARQLAGGASARDALDHLLGARASRGGARRLVREAPLGLDGGVLLDALDAPGIDVNDLPAADEARRTWYSWAASWQRVSTRRRPPWAARFGGFVSRHAAALDAVTRDERSDPHTVLSTILDHAWHTAAPPGRDSSPTRVMATLQAWHEQLWASDVEPATALRTGPAIFPLDDEIVISPIATAGELAIEGREQRHCVASYAALGAAGELCFYRAVIAGERLTLAITDRGGRWRLVEAAGVCNRPASTRANRAIAAWLSALDAV